MDFHPPEGGIHSWRDFVVHLSIVVLGIVIAIGLEQGVETIHNRHLRERLQQELRVESERNAELMQVDFKRLATERVALLGEREAVERRIGSGKAGPFERSPDVGTIALPSESAWDSAKASGRVALLPDDQAEVYSYLYLQEEWMKTQANEWFDAMAATQEFEQRFDPRFGQMGDEGAPDLSQMSGEDLKEYFLLLDKEITQQGQMAGILHYFDAANRAVLGGARSQEEVIRRVDADDR